MGDMADQEVDRMTGLLDDYGQTPLNPGALLKRRVKTGPADPRRWIGMLCRKPECAGVIMLRPGEDRPQCQKCNQHYT